MEYRVTGYERQFITVTVEASSWEEAVARAYDALPGDRDYSAEYDVDFDYVAPVDEDGVIDMDRGISRSGDEWLDDDGCFVKKDRAVWS